MTGDRPDARELAAGLEAELRALAADAPGPVRMRLLVAAHAAGLLARDGGALAAGDHELAAAIRAGEHDAALPELARRLRAQVAARVDVSSPGYRR